MTATETKPKTDDLKMKASAFDAMMRKALSVPHVPAKPKRTTKKRAKK